MFSEVLFGSILVLKKFLVFYDCTLFVTRPGVLFEICICKNIFVAEKKGSIVRTGLKKRCKRLVQKIRTSFKALTRPRTISVLL